MQWLMQGKALITPQPRDLLKPSPVFGALHKAKNLRVIGTAYDLSSI